MLGLNSDDIFDAFNEIRRTIDPNKLKNFEHSINVDKDLLLYRESKEGLTNLIIHTDEDFAYSYIGNETGRELNFYETEADYESISLKFFSN